MIVGVVSDTHGLLRDEARRALRGSELILHAGDVGSADVLRGLATLSPLRAVRGNNDRGAWADDLPERVVVDARGVRILVVHRMADVGDVPDRVRVVVTGHSHVPACERRGGVLFLNPGSAGPRRFRLPVTIARLEVGRRVRARIVEIL